LIYIKKVLFKEKKQQMEEMRVEMVSKILSPEAKERLSRIKLVKPDKATQLENYLLKMAQGGQFSEQVSEAYLVNLLEKISETKKETSVKFIRKNKIDDDDDF